MQVGSSAPASAFSPSPLLRHFENVCVHIAYKGSMNRQAYAWFATDDGQGNALPRQLLPDPPLFSRHVEFLNSSDDVNRIRTWWKPQDVNRTVGVTKYRTSASDLAGGYKPKAVRWLRNTSWFIDVSHGGTPNLWTNICHFSNSMFPFFEAANAGRVCRRPLEHILMWQVASGAWAAKPEGYHRGVMNSVLSEYRRHHAHNEHSMSPELLFDEDVAAGITFCFDEVVIVREPNLQHRKLFLQTRSSMHTAGVARGFSTLSTRFAFRRAILSTLQIPVPEARPPTITYLSRPMGAKDAKLHGRAWQLRCHIKMPTFHRLQKTIFKASGYRLARTVFEQTTYAFQARVISETDIFWGSHGAGMVHIPLLPKDSAVIEMFNCGHFSYLYAQLALHAGVRYFLMQRTEPWCSTPSTFYGDTRKNMSKTYAYTYAEAEPVLMQAVRYHMWQDPGPELSGREASYCIAATKILHATGTLPIGMTPKRWSSECSALAFTNAGGPVFRSRLSRRGAAASRADPPEGDGTPGQWTRWAGLG